MSSVNLENVGQGHHLQILYFGSYTTDLNQTFTKIMQLVLATKARSHAIWRVFNENLNQCKFINF